MSFGPNWKGGYSAANVDTAGDHGNPLEGRYKRDQRRQRLFQEGAFRDEGLEETLKKFLARERREWDKFVAPVHDRLGRTFDPAGRVLTSPEIKERRKDLVETRGKFYDPKSKRWRKLREQTYIKGPDGKPLLFDGDGKPVAEGEDGKFRNSDGVICAKPKKHRCEVPEEKVRRILHEATMLDPRASWMLVLAARASESNDAMIEAYQRRVGAACAAKVKEKTGATAELVPFHPKALGGHFQLEVPPVDADGTFHAKLRNAVHLGRKMTAVARFRAMGFKGAELDALTGMENSDAGLDEALDGRGAEALDLATHQAVDAEHAKIMAESEFAAVFQPYWEQACKDYDAYLDRRRAVIAAEQSNKRERSEALERARLAEAAKAEAEAKAAEETKAREAAEAKAAELSVKSEAEAKARAESEAKLTVVNETVAELQSKLDAAVIGSSEAAKLAEQLRKAEAATATAEAKAAAETKRATNAETKEKNLRTEAETKFRAYREQMLAWSDKRVKEAVEKATPKVETVPAEGQAELERLRAANAKLEAQVAELRPTYKKWPMKDLAAAIKRIAEGTSGGADECVLDEHGRVSDPVRDYLQEVVRSKVSNPTDRGYAREGFDLAKVHDRVCEAEKAKELLRARAIDVEQESAGGREEY